MGQRAGSRTLAPRPKGWWCRRLRHNGGPARRRAWRRLTYLGREIGPKDAGARNWAKRGPNRAVPWPAESPRAGEQIEYTNAGASTAGGAMQAEDEKDDGVV